MSSQQPPGTSQPPLCRTPSPAKSQGSSPARINTESLGDFWNHMWAGSMVYKGLIVTRPGKVAFQWLFQLSSSKQLISQWPLESMLCPSRALGWAVQTGDSRCPSCATLRDTGHRTNFILSRIAYFSFHRRPESKRKPFFMDTCRACGSTQTVLKYRLLRSML